ncbi:hypothetical protein HW555_011051 [Spodoptera exigua]|uniref:Uncharacterized protein n=1 Tax=Spodoptera exigua TaxID=7107 RepID=A0A835G633_SPOEX|nr:hypothetical protein HW555_011051 [Spodoptera exigua]
MALFYQNRLWRGEITCAIISLQYGLMLTPRQVSRHGVRLRGPQAQHHVSRHDGRRPHDECQRRLRPRDSASDSSAVDSVRDPPSPSSATRIHHSHVHSRATMEIQNMISTSSNPEQQELHRKHYYHQGIKKS